MEPVKFNANDSLYAPLRFSRVRFSNGSSDALPPLAVNDAALPVPLSGTVIELIAALGDFAAERRVVANTLVLESIVETRRPIRVPATLLEVAVPPTVALPTPEPREGIASNPTAVEAIRDPPVSPVHVPPAPPPPSLTLQRSVSVVGSWPCGTCTFSNSPEVLCCAVCGAEKPIHLQCTDNLIPSSGFVQSSHGELVSCDVWECSCCTLENASDAETCTACGGDRPKVITAVHVEEKTWACKFCTYPNVEGTDVCSICQSPRG